MSVFLIYVLSELGRKIRRNLFMDIFAILSLIGGLALFLYGMNVMGDGLTKVSGGKLEKILEKLTSNPIKAVLLGAGVTAVIQSSSATTVMVVGFVNSGIMKLSQAVGIIMGANVGTTITSWILSLSGIQSSSFFIQMLKPTSFSPILAIIGLLLMMSSKNDKHKDVGSILLGFAVLMFGMDAMSSAVEPLKDVPQFTHLLTMFTNPLLGMLAGLILTAIIQSSSASVGILQSLAAAGLVPFNAAVYIIMGQNIGTCVTAIMSSIGAKKTAKTAAIMHLLFNVIGTIIFSVAAIFFFKVLNPGMGAGMITQTEISTVHTIFNIGTTLLLFPVSDWIIKLARKLQKEEDGVVDESRVLLDERMLETPSIAIQSVVSEVCRMGYIVKGTMDKTRRVLFTQDEETMNEIREEESIADRLCKGITDYLIRISSLAINEKEHQHVASLLQIVSDIERISDYCENISEYAENLANQKKKFSGVGAAEMKEMLEVCSDSFTYAVEAFEENSAEKALKVIEKERSADDLEIRLRADHMQRLANKQCDTEAGIVFLDALVGLERISDHSRNIAEEVLSASNK